MPFPRNTVFPPKTPHKVSRKRSLDPLEDDIDCENRSPDEKRSRLSLRSPIEISLISIDAETQRVRNDYCSTATDLPEFLPSLNVTDYRYYTKTQDRRLEGSETGSTLPSYVSDMVEISHRLRS